MTPTEADYETLARTLLVARGDDPEDWDYEAIGDSSTCVSVTRDTLDEFRHNAKSWREPGRCEEIDGGLYWAECQAIKGQRRGELCIVDCGEFRLVYQC